MKKSSIFLIAFSLLLLSCGGGGSSSSLPKSSSSNESPVINGYVDEVEKSLGEVWNSLEGVKATDKEDGDLSDEIIVSIDPNDLPLDGGLITCSIAGEYLVKYMVSDSSSSTDTQWTNLIVKKEKTLTELYSFPTTSSYSWEVPSPLSYTNKKEGLLIEGKSDEDVVSSLSLGVLESGDYSLSLGLGQSLVGEGSLAVGSVSTSLVAGSSMASLDFTIEEEKKTDLSLSLKGMEGISCLLVSLKLTSSKSSAPLIEETFAKEGYATRLDKGSIATIVSGEGYVGVSISKYPEGDEGWALGFAKASNYNVINGEKYSLSITLESTYPQEYEFMAQPNVWGPDDQRTAYASGSLVSGTNSLDLSFTADKDVKNAFFEFYLGKDGRDETMTNDQLIKLTSLVLSPTSKTETITLINENYLSAENATNLLFNTDPGAGSLYYEDGKLVYDIVSFGDSDWKNKVQLTGLVLSSVGSYRVSFDVSSTSDLTFGFYLSPKEGDWDPLVSISQVSASSLATSKAFDFVFSKAQETSYDLFFQFGGNSGTAIIALSNIAIFAIN